jgi:CheY-like chemotaxis protein
MLKVLLVEDNLSDRELIHKSLGNRAVIKEATSGEQAFEILSEEKFDCILLDSHLPDCDSGTFINTIRRQGICTSVVTISELGDELLAVRSIKLGSAGHMPKKKINGGFFDFLSTTIQEEAFQRKECELIADVNVKIRRKLQEYAI